MGLLVHLIIVVVDASSLSSHLAQCIFLDIVELEVYTFAPKAVGTQSNHGLFKGLKLVPMQNLLLLRLKFVIGQQAGVAQMPK
jgi:hypothetical protein